jgi:hypothetical protein
VLQQELGAGVDRRRGLVEDQQLGVREEGPGDGDQLPLTRGEVGAVLLEADGAYARLYNAQFVAPEESAVA